MMYGGASKPACSATLTEGLAAVRQALKVVERSKSPSSSGGRECTRMKASLRAGWRADVDIHNGQIYLF